MTQTQPWQVEISPDKMSACVHFSGMAYPDFGRTETLSHWPLSRVFEATRYFALTRGMLEVQDLINRKTSYFVLGGQYHYQDALWRILRHQDIPFKVGVEVQDVGKTSVTLFNKMVNKLDNKVLATACIKLVFVDRATRRPIPLPEWMRDRCMAAIKHRQPMSFPQNAPAIPESAFSMVVTVTASDTDVNRHTNQGSYVRFCSDAAQSAVSAGRLAAFAPDIARFPLQSSQAVYIGESGFGDSLHVYLWQQEDDLRLVNFVITRKTEIKSVPIFHGYMKYGLVPVRASKL